MLVSQVLKLLSILAAERFCKQPGRGVDRRAQARQQRHLQVYQARGLLVRLPRGRPLPRWHEDQIFRGLRNGEERFDAWLWCIPLRAEPLMSGCIAS